MNRKTSTLVLAVALMVVVMVIAVILYLAGPPREKWTIERYWEADIADAETIKGINMAGDLADEIFAQSLSRVLILDYAGQSLFDLSIEAGKTTMGNLNDDDLDEFVVIYLGDEGFAAEAYTGVGEPLWTRALPDIILPSRATSVDLFGDRVREIVVGDEVGRLACLGSDGQILWEYSLPEVDVANAYVRGLDDISLGDGRSLIAAANYEGDVVLLDANGQELWSQRFPQPLRRLRAYDLDGDGASEIILGGEGGRVEALNRDGQSLWTASSGGKITEMRDAELDGDPVTREVVVGTKEGALLGFDAAGRQVFRASLGSRVEAIAGIDLDGDGMDEIVAGSDTGQLSLYRSDGSSLIGMSLGSAVTKIDGGKRLEPGEFIVSTARDVSLQRVGVKKAPWWYNPLTAGLLACLIIAGAAWALSGLRPPPRLEYSADELTVEALRAKRRMLKESLAEVRHLQKSGEVPPDAYTARTRELRAHIARVEADLIKLGVEITPEVMQCPNCGGALDIGADQCEYCGQTIL